MVTLRYKCDMLIGHGPRRVGLDQDARCRLHARLRADDDCAAPVHADAGILPVTARDLTADRHRLRSRVPVVALDKDTVLHSGDSAAMREVRARQGKLRHLRLRPPFRNPLAGHPPHLL